MNRSRFINIRKALLVMACVIITCLFQVAVTVLAEGGIPSDYSQIVYDQDSGLGSREVNCVYQAKSGYIWVGTDGGLYRFNGKEFKIYNLWDTEKADVYFINSFFQDSRGRLWVSTNNYGLFYIDGRDIVHFSSEYYNGVKCVYEACEGADGTIYVATAYGVYTVDEASDTLIRIEELARHNVKGITLAGNEIWGIYNGNKIFRISETGKIDIRNSSDFTEEELSTITADDSGRIYIGTIGNEVIRFKSFYNFSTLRSGRDGVNFLYPYSSRLYVCTDNGIGFFNERDEFSVINGTEIGNYFSSMVIDYEGNLWLGSSRNGLLFLGRSKFTDFNNRYGLPESPTNCMVERNGIRYIGTDEGIIVLDSSNRYITDDENLDKLKEYLSRASVKHILCDSTGNVWFSTYRRYGIVKYSPDGSIKSFDRYSGLSTNLVNCSYELRDGRIAVATEEGVSIIDTNDEITATYSYSDGLDYANIISLYQDDQGIIYAGSDGGGIYLISSTGIDNVTDRDGLSSNVISSIVPGSNGLWIGTDNGLSYYDEIYRGVSNIDFSNNIYDIIVRDGRVMLLGSKGLLITTEDELLSAGSLPERYLGKGDGLSRNLNVSSHSMLDSEGRLYICCNSGVETINTEEYYINTEPPKLTVSEVDVDGNIYYLDQLGGELVVPSDTQRVAISFSVLSFMNRDNISVNYRLRGFDTQDITLSGNDTMQAVYTNLDAGSYVFTVEAVNGDGVESENIISFTIVKQPGFFERTEVKLAIASIVMLLIGILIYTLLKYRSQFERKNKEIQHLAEEHETALKTNSAKTDYLANMSNEIKTPVNAMIESASKLIREAETSEEDKEELRSIVATGNDVLERVDETIQLARLESGSITATNESYSLTTLICDLSDHMVNNLAEQPIKFLVDLGDNIPDILTGDFDKLKSILSIILDNSVKYTKEGSITLSVDSFTAPGNLTENPRERLVFSVSDTGIGMTKDRIEHIFEIYYISENKNTSGYSGSGISLVIAKRLVDIIGGDIEVESTYGAGTTVTITLDQEKPVDARPDSASERVSKEEADKMWAPDVHALVVDDSDLSRNVTTGLLSRMEMKIDAASSGISAIDMVMNNRYDIVFMDIAMPVMNGVDAMHEIRDLSDEAVEGIPIIGMTEDALLKNHDELTEEGFSDVVIKPFDIITLATVMRKFLPDDKVKIRTNDVKQYLSESRYSEGLKKLENYFDVVRTLDRIGGNIDVYNKILSSFYEQNKDAPLDLKRRFNSDYRGFRTRIHNIRTGCQNIGAADAAEITSRVENAINLGNKSYARDNLDMLIEALKNVLQYIREYFEYIEQEKGISDEEYAALHKKEHGERGMDTSADEESQSNDAPDRNPDDVSDQPSIINLEELHRLQRAVEDKNDRRMDEIFVKISSRIYVAEDMDFIQVLGENVERRDYDTLNELILTYFSLKSV